MDEDQMICNCIEVDKSKIVASIIKNELTTVEQVQDFTEAGTGCGSCIEEIEYILDEVNKNA